MKKEAQDKFNKLIKRYLLKKVSIGYILDMEMAGIINVLDVMLSLKQV